MFCCCIFPRKCRPFRVNIIFIYENGLRAKAFFFRWKYQIAMKIFLIMRNCSCSKTHSQFSSNVLRQGTSKRLSVNAHTYTLTICYYMRRVCAVSIQRTCNWHTVNILCVCAVSIQRTCNGHTVNILWACSEPAVSIQQTCNGHWGIVYGSNNHNHETNSLVSRKIFLYFLDLRTCFSIQENIHQ